MVLVDDMVLKLLRRRCASLSRRGCGHSPYLHGRDASRVGAKRRGRGAMGRHMGRHKL